MYQSGIDLPLLHIPGRGLWIKGPKVVRDLEGLPPLLCRTGPLELRLATTKKQIRKVQRLRYDVFYQRGDAIPNAYQASLRRDTCPFDRVCDHLYVVDTSRPGPLHKEHVVGTTRLLRSDMAAAHDGFYSESEFVLEPLFERHADKRFLEIGRSCVHPDFRSRRVIDLLWQGIGRYAAHHGSDVLIGCSSLKGTRSETLATPLSYIFHHAACSADWQVTATPARAARMDWLDKSSFDPRQALASLPPLVKAYVRMGSTFATEAAVDHQFGTTDLFTVMPLAAANLRYLAQFGPALAQVA